MTRQDDLDRILGQEPPVEPSPFFAARVMQAVHLDAGHRRKGYLRWAPMWPALAAAATALPLIATAEMIDASMTMEGLALRLSHVIGLTLLVTFGMAAWCTGLLRSH